MDLLNPLLAGRALTNKEGGYRMEYDTEEEATDGVNYTRERYGRDVLAYICSSCDKWHIG